MVKQKAQERGRGNKEKSIWRCKYTNKCAFEAKNGCTAYYRGRLIKKGCVCVCVCVCCHKSKDRLQWASKQGRRI